MPEPRRTPSRQALAIGAAVVVIIVIVVVAVIAMGGDDDDAGTTSSTGPTAIMSPATVTGITGVSGVTDPADGSGVADPTYTVVRTLVAAGTYDCATPGGWQPFAAMQIVVAVGEPAAEATCGDTVLDLPAGFCSSSPCSAVPDTWRVEVQDGVSPQALMMLVAPTDDATGQFLCYRDFTARPKQTLPLDTPIETACATPTSDSVEIPYVPPATSDIPYTPPPVSVDLPAG